MSSGSLATRGVSSGAGRSSTSAAAGMQYVGRERNSSRSSATNNVDCNTTTNASIGTRVASLREGGAFEKSKIGFVGNLADVVSASSAARSFFYHQACHQDHHRPQIQAASNLRPSGLARSQKKDSLAGSGRSNGIGAQFRAFSSKSGPKSAGSEGGSPSKVKLPDSTSAEAPESKGPKETRVFSADGRANADGSAAGKGTDDRDTSAAAGLDSAFGSRSGSSGDTRHSEASASDEHKVTAKDNLKEGDTERDFSNDRGGEAAKKNDDSSSSRTKDGDVPNEDRNREGSSRKDESESSGIQLPTPKSMRRSIMKLTLPMCELISAARHQFVAAPLYEQYQKENPKLLAPADDFVEGVTTAFQYVNTSLVQNEDVAHLKPCFTPHLWEQIKKMGRPHVW